MFAVLGDIEFELITYWDGFEATFGVDYAEHARIEGKPGLQFVGDRLDEIQISLVFHQHYCVPDVELARVRTAMKAHQALALVFGNGDYRGWFVITDVTATSEQTDSTGNVLAVSATVSLREYTGDPKNPLQPPAIRRQVPGAGAVSGAVPSPSGVAQFVRNGVNYAKQAQSVLQTTISAVRVAQKMKGNPVVALTRVPGLMSGLGNISGALGKSVPAFNALSESMPDAISLARTASEAATYVQQAQSALSGVDKRNIAGALDTVSGQLNAAGTAFNRMSPGLSAMAARILTRSVMFLEHITRDGERWDSLAWQYYGDPLGYPRIIAANPHVAITPVLPSGVLLLIPVIEAEDARTEEDIAPWLR
ncbi:hypothetical protein HFQ69_23510 [Salmonella enterica subsp. enterica serovar Agona]|nr:hypothetical protein HFQ69_23510 [Salmonella enterica subsp. enterica serovar Agona]